MLRTLFSKCNFSPHLCYNINKIVYITRLISTTSSYLDKCKSGADGDKDINMKDRLFKTMTVPGGEEGKVTIVGAGRVGQQIAFILLCQHITHNILLIDVNKDTSFGEALDLQHGSKFLCNAQVKATENLSDASDSRIIIITAGARQEKGESRLQLLEKNTLIMKEIIPQLLGDNKCAIIIMATNPVDILTDIAWRYSGLGLNRVIGSGTHLDTSRFKTFLGRRLNCSTKAINGFVIGEHGDSSVVVWSQVEVGGVRLRDLNPKIGLPDDPEKFNEIHKEVITAAGKIIKAKGYTSSGIALAIADIVRSIFINAEAIMPVTTLAKGMHGIEKDVFLSLPCVIGTNGIHYVVKQNLTDDERANLHKSADILTKARDGET